MKLINKFMYLLFFCALLNLPIISTANAHELDAKGYVNCLKTKLDHFDGTIAEAAAATPELSALFPLLGLQVWMTR